MKTKKIIAALSILMCCLFAACSNDDNDWNSNEAPTEELAKALRLKYPNAGNVKWNKKGSYDVATFTLTETRAENLDTVSVWFNAKAQIRLVDEETDFGSLPQAVKDGFNKAKDVNGVLYSDAKVWKVDDVYMLNRDSVIAYKIEVESVANDDVERDLQFNELGVLIKDEKHLDEDEMPLDVPEKLMNWIDANYKGAAVVDYEYEKDDAEHELDLLQKNVSIELALIEKDGGFVITEEEYEYQSLSDLPQDIQDKVKAAIDAHKGVSADDIEEIEMKKKNGEEVYTVEFEKNNAEYELEVVRHADGTIDAGTVKND